MRILLSFIFIFGILSFTKGQNLNGQSTLADSATYFAGVLSAEGQFRYLETLGADENTFKKKLFLKGAKWALTCDVPDDYNGYDAYGSLLINSYLHELERPDERMYAKDRKILIDSSSYAWGVTAVLYNRAILDARGLNKNLFFSGIQVGLDREFNHLERQKEAAVVAQYMESLPEKTEPSNVSEQKSFSYIFNFPGVSNGQNPSHQIPSLDRKPTLTESASYVMGKHVADDINISTTELSVDENTLDKKRILDGARWALNCSLPQIAYEHGALLWNRCRNELTEPDKSMSAKDRTKLIDSFSYFYGASSILPARTMLDLGVLNKDLLFSGFQVGLYNGDIDKSEKKREGGALYRFFYAFNRPDVAQDQKDSKSKEISILDANSTLVDSVSYYIGFYTMSETYVYLRYAYDFNQELFLLGARETIVTPSNNLDNACLKASGVAKRYFIELELRAKTAQSLEEDETLLPIGEKASSAKTLSANSSFADSASYCLGVMQVNPYKENQPDFNKSVYLEALQSRIDKEFFEFDYHSVKDLINRYLISREKYIIPEP